MKPRHAALLLLTVACSSSGAGTEPQPGTWAFSSNALVDNKCGAGDATPTEPTGNFVLAAAGERGFTVTDASFTNPLDCSYDGDSFTCPETAAETNKPEPSIDATVTYNVTLDGTLTSATALVGTQEVEITCTGESCDLAASVLGVTMLPCTYSYNFSAESH